MKDYCEYCHPDSYAYISDLCEEYDPNLGGIPIRLKSKLTFKHWNEDDEVSAEIGLKMDKTLRMNLNVWDDGIHVSIDEGFLGADVFEPSVDDFIKLAELKVNYCPFCGRKLKKED